MNTNRVEKLTYWYLRFNGYLSVENFTVHPDFKKKPEAEADILAVRFPKSKENPGKFRFPRDERIIIPENIDFIIGEVKKGMCSINENSWGDSSREHVQYALEWMGFLPDDVELINLVAEDLYQKRLWQENGYSVRFVCFGNKENEELKKNYKEMPQILLNDMVDFVFNRLTTYCNSLHRENWDSFINHYVDLIEGENAGSTRLLEWTLS